MNADDVQQSPSLKPAMPDRRISRLLWLVFATAFVVLAWQFQDQLEMVFSARGTLTVEEQPDRVVLRWRGKIAAPMASRLEEAFRAHAGSNQRFLLSLHSPGGNLEHGRDVIRLIRTIQKKRTVDTVVEDRYACASMCVPVYLTGTHRTAGPRARFMFHEVSFRDSLSDKIERVPKAAIGQATDQFFERYLKPTGLDKRWLAELRESVRGKDVWFTARQLVDQRTGVVQALE